MHVVSDLQFDNTRIRGLLAPVNADEPERKQDHAGKRIYRNTNVSGSVNIDWGQYDEVRFTLTGNASFTFTNAFDGQGCIMKLKQDGVGGHSITLPGNIRYSVDMRTYSMTAGAGCIDRIGFMYDNDDGKYDFISTVRNLT